MQTFLPDPSFECSASLLDTRRLGKQRVEALQILRALHLEEYGWADHPAVRMWQGRTRALVAYGLAMVDEWCARGHSDATRANIAEFAAPEPALLASSLPDDELPPWLGQADVHRSHRAALVRKDPEQYGPLFPDATPDLPYVWPPPPAERPPAAPFTAWVLRAGPSDLAAELAALGAVGLPSAFEGTAAMRKEVRQLRRWRHEAREGDAVVMLAGDELQVGLIVGAPGESDVAGQRYVTRPVQWRRTMPRFELRRPYRLQDPKALFALRGEPQLLA